MGGKLPQWAPRVKQRKIRQLYEHDANGIYDDELIDDVGYSLLARCESFITASGVWAGTIFCPECTREFQRDSTNSEILQCTCGWELPWATYYSTIRRKQLVGAEPVLAQFRDYCRSFPGARTAREKVLLIDTLIHGFHLYLKDLKPTRPVAVNLIEGNLGSVVKLLDDLSYGDESTPGTRENFDQWNKNIDVHIDWFAAIRNRER